MKRYAENRRWLLRLALIPILVASSATILTSTHIARADTDCSRQVYPCIDVHRIPRGNYYGTVYVDGSHFVSNDEIQLEYWIDGVSRFLPPIRVDGAGNFHTTIPPHCAYSYVAAMAFSRVSYSSNRDSVPSIC
jgi:hypothetical protein